MGNRTDNSLRVSLIFGSVLLMLAAMFTTRVGLSAGMIAFLVLTCVHQNFLAQLHCFFRNKLLVGISLLFLIPLISGIWSDDTEQWLRFVRIKLPLLFFPLAFAGEWQFTKKQWIWVNRAFILVVFSGTSWSLYHYFQNMPAIHVEYLKAKTLATPLQNDHIRFSLLVVFSIISTVFLIWNESSKRLQGIYLVIALFFAAYLHVLSARTGLAGLYIFIFAGSVAILIKQKKRRLMFFLLSSLILIPLIASWLFPTFQNRIRYMMYDLQHIASGQYLPGSNDGSRMVSLQAGWSILKEKPMGVGAGDVLMETRKWYEQNVPNMTMKNLYPSSEWLMYGCMAGWPGLLVFTLVMLLPFIVYRQNDFFFHSVSFIMAFSFLFDIGLEVQFGVFIYVFVLLWWWKIGRIFPAWVSSAAAH